MYDDGKRVKYLMNVYGRNVGVSSRHNQENAIFMTDEKGRILDWNSAFAERFPRELGSDGVVGRECLERCALFRVHRQQKHLPVPRLDSHTLLASAAPRRAR